MSIYVRPCKRKECKGKKCKHKHFHYRFRISGVRYREAIPEARTTVQAEQAENKIKQDVYDGKYQIQASGKENVGEFIEKDYLPWARTNKKSFKNDDSRSKVIVKRFGAKAFREITPEMIEKFKSDLNDSITRRGTRRSQADVNRHIEFISSVFELAIKYKRVSINPCRQVKRFKLDNQRYRYLWPEEEPKLLAVLTGRLKHLKPLVVVAIGTGLRKQELLRLRRDQVDLSRNLVVATHTKGKRNREIPMNDEVREVLLSLCRGKASGDPVFANPITKQPYTDIKHAFTKACENAGITGLWWHDLRATFGTRLGEAGHGLSTIMYLMGHRDPKTCLRYVRATEPANRAAVAAASLRGGHKMDTRRLVAV